MDYLWSPWRYQYVTSGAPETPGVDPCLFCRIAGSAQDRENYVLHRAKRNFILLNRYPYATGHLLIAPYEHVATLEEAQTETMEELIRLAQRAEAAVRGIYRAGGVNLGFNIGQCAGAGMGIPVSLPPRAKPGCFPRTCRRVGKSCGSRSTMKRHPVPHKTPHKTFRQIRVPD
jgi:ATP adenylyltransferase